MHRPKKPERLGVDPFKGYSRDTQLLIQDREIKPDYFRESLGKDLANVSLLIALLQGSAKTWYNNIHPYVSEEAACREGIPFNPKNVHRTSAGFRQQLVSSFCGHSYRDRALMEWNDWTIKSGKIDHFCDELMRPALELGYSVNFVNDNARVGITTDLCNVWALQTALPEEYVEYIILLRQTGDHMEDVASFNRMATREKYHSKPERSHYRQSSAKRQRKERNPSGPGQKKPLNHASGSSRPQETEHMKMHGDIPQSLIEKRKRLNQCS